MAVIQLFLSFATLAFTVALPPTDRSDRNILKPFADWWKNTSIIVKFLNMTLCLIAGVALGGVIYYYLKGPPIEAADQVTIQGDRILTNTHKVALRFPSPTPDRENLGIKLALGSDPSGDCVTLARLTLYPVINGAPQNPVEVEHLDDETRVEIGGPVRNLAIRVGAEMDQGCQVKLSISGAAFYD